MGPTSVQGSTELFINVYTSLCTQTLIVIQYAYALMMRPLLVQDDSFVAHFKYHKSPITSIEWSPHEASTVGVTSGDNQMTYYALHLKCLCSLSEWLS